MNAGRPTGTKDIRVYRDGKYVTPRSLPTVDRFMCYVEKTADGCWNWTGDTCKKGYGRFSFRGRLVLTHRFSFEQFRGPIPDGLEIDHLCRNRACANPDHLEAVSHRTNVLRSPINPISVAANRTTCQAGHELPDTVGARRCFTCRPARKSTDERLAESYSVDAAGCWIWSAEIANGYPRFFAAGRRWQAVRYVYALTVGPIDDGAALVMDCDKLCVNPEHATPVIDRRWHPKAA